MHSWKSLLSEWCALHPINIGLHLSEATGRLTGSSLSPAVTGSSSSSGWGGQPVRREPPPPPSTSPWWAHGQRHRTVSSVIMSYLSGLQREVAPSTSVKWSAELEHSETRALGTFRTIWTINTNWFLINLDCEIFIIYSMFKYVNRFDLHCESQQMMYALIQHLLWVKIIKCYNFITQTHAWDTS